MPAKTDLLQGTLDLLILKVIAQGPLHGYGIAQKILLTSKEMLQVQQGSLYPALAPVTEKRIAEIRMERVRQRTDGETIFTHACRTEATAGRNGAMAALYRGHRSGARIVTEE